MSRGLAACVNAFSFLDRALELSSSLGLFKRIGNRVFLAAVCSTGKLYSLYANEGQFDWLCQIRKLLYSHRVLFGRSDEGLHRPQFDFRSRSRWVQASMCHVPGYAPHSLVSGCQQSKGKTGCSHEPAVSKNPCFTHQAGVAAVNLAYLDE
jgi:hypothetical protein